jgi:hypothetical protein
MAAGAVFGARLFQIDKVDHSGARRCLVYERASGNRYFEHAESNDWTLFGLCALC